MIAAQGKILMPNTSERQGIRDAMDRLLNGTPIRSNGSLNVVALAQEAGVKRHLLTHRHTDLREEFYDRVRSQGHVPQSEVALRKKVADLETTVARLRQDHALLAAEVVVLRRMNNVLQVEKGRVDEALQAITTGQVSSIYGNAPRGKGHPSDSEAGAEEVDEDLEPPSLG
jgi:hypothetical protein